MVPNKEVLTSIKSGNLDDYPLHLKMCVTTFRSIRNLHYPNKRQLPKEWLKENY